MHFFDDFDTEDGLIERGQAMSDQDGGAWSIC